MSEEEKNTDKNPSTDKNAAGTSEQAGQTPGSQGQQQTQSEGATQAAATGGQQQADDVASLPDWAQKELKEARDQAASYRIKNKELADQSQATLDAIAKALGLKQDDDPAKVAEEKSKELDATKGLLRSATVELAVIRAAAKQGASPEALVDSRAFMNKLSGLDPAAEDFAEKLEAAIKAAVEANPTLKVEPPVPAKSGTRVGGGASPDGERSVEDFVAEFNKTK